MSNFMICWLVGWVITCAHEVFFAEDVKRFSTQLTILVVLANLIVWPFIAFVAITRLIMHPDDVKFVDEQVKKEMEDEL